MKNTPLISVLIPCYNHEKYIYNTIQSILAQTYTNIEVIVADDCSPDNSVMEIKRIKDPRVKTFFFTENHGTVYTLNFLIKQSTGQYIAAIGSDDYFAPDKLEKQMQVFEENPSLGAVFTWANVVNEYNEQYCGTEFDSAIFDQQNRSQAEWIRLFFHHGNRLCHPSALVKKSVHDDIGLYRMSYRQLHDFDMWVRLLLKYPIHIIPERLIYYRRENDCTSVSAPSHKNTYRVYNETSSIFLWLFKNMDDAFFLEAFGDLVSVDCVENKQKMHIEKYKILRQLRSGVCAIRSAATQYFIEFIDDSIDYSGDLDILSELIGQFYEDTAQPANDYPNHLQSMSELAYLREHSTQMENTLTSILSSKSWKITKPLRALTARLK